MALLTAFDIQALSRSDQDQVTIWASLTDDTTRTIAALLADPRIDSGPGPSWVVPFGTRPHGGRNDPC